MEKQIPNYLLAFENKQIDSKIDQAYEILKKCTLCPRNCEVNRLDNELGTCNTGKRAKIASYGPHFGEEAPLVGQRGSGTIFFSNCNLLCNFCQNFDISHLGSGKEITDYELADIMLYLQDMGCHNINLVTPSHVVPQFLEGLKIAARKGLNIPLVYNTSAYDNLETIRLLDGIVDIYMPDFKFWDSKASEEACDAKDYPEKAKLAIKEMHEQVGRLQLNEEEIAYKGLMIRHLVMPNNIADIRPIMRFIAKEISPLTYVNIMAQYRPCYEASAIENISRPITKSEFDEALKIARDEGLERIEH